MGATDKDQEYISILTADVDSALEVVLANREHPLLGPAITPTVFSAVFQEIRSYRRKQGERVDLEHLAQITHDNWMERKMKLGYHHPDACPNQPQKGDRGCSRCHLEIKQYYELPERVKLRKKDTVRVVLDALGITMQEDGGKREVTGICDNGSEGGECCL